MRFQSGFMLITTEPLFFASAVRASEKVPTCVSGRPPAGPYTTPAAHHRGTPREPRLLRVRDGSSHCHRFSHKALSVEATLVILGELSIQGNIREVKTLVAPPCPERFSLGTASGEFRSAASRRLRFRFLPRNGQVTRNGYASVCHPCNSELLTDQRILRLIAAFCCLAVFGNPVK